MHFAPRWIYKNLLLYRLQMQTSCVSWEGFQAQGAKWKHMCVDQNTSPPSIKSDVVIDLINREVWHLYIKQLKRIAWNYFSIVSWSFHPDQIYWSSNSHNIICSLWISWIDWPLHWSSVNWAYHMVQGTCSKKCFFLYICIFANNKENQNFYLIKYILSKRM